MYLRLALPSPLRRLFDYHLPEGVPPEDCHPGCRVQVPFGRRTLIGILIEVTPESSVAEQRLRTAEALLDRQPLLPPVILKLCQWASHYYQHGLGETLANALPGPLRKGEPARLTPQTRWLANPEQTDLTALKRRAPRQAEALEILHQHPHGLAPEQLKPLGISPTLLKALRDKGLVRQIESLPSHAEPAPERWLLEPELSLNDEQRQACECIRSHYRSFHPFLLVGVTGSGKTEVYLQLIHDQLRQGHQVLVLIPEINLGPQTLNRFRQRFRARIAILHSGLSDRERLQAWLEARDGQAQIVIGTRSALFVPLQRPGLIIVDEEHDASYKQQDGLRYHARDLALVRARLENVPVVLGSATPALESLHNARIGRYGLLELKQRAGKASPPRFQRLDIRSLPLDAGLSEPLQRLIRQTLEAGQQALLYLNRRGFAPVLLCHHCGWTSQCSRCDARMTLHQKSRELRCHHCLHSEPQPRRCPKCQHVDLRPIGAGTERIEERLNILFPEFPVLRIDRDTTRRKGSLEQMLETVHQGQPAILIGTQMLGKGHHFPQVTLVGILDADGGLFSSDFRAPEHMAQQIIQVAGRAGRERHPGRVIIQTHQADHPLLVQLTEQGYLAFARQALADRRATELPPFSHLALLRAEAHQVADAQAFLDQAVAQADEQLQGHGDSGITILGPIPAPMERRAGRYRMQVLLQAQARTPLQHFMAHWVRALESLPNGRKVRWSLDIDPIDLG